MIARSLPAPRPMPRLCLALALVGGVYACAIAIAGSGLMHEAPGTLSLAIALDLTVTAGVVAYLVLVRPGIVPRAVLAPLLLAGLLTASWLVPEGQERVVTALGLAWGALEMALILVVATRIGRVVRVTRAARRRGLHLARALAEGLTAALGHARVAEILAQEAVAVYHGLLGWLRRAPRVDGKTSFSHHREHPWGAAVFGLSVITLGEGLAVHVLLAKWSPVAAIIATALHAYTLLWLLGDYQSMRHSPIVLDARERALRIAIGLRLHLDVSLDDIEWIGTDASQIDTTTRDHLRGTVMGDPNVLVRFRAPQTATMLFGRERACATLDLRVDRPDELVGAVQAHLARPAPAQPGSE